MNNELLDLMECRAYCRPESKHQYQVRIGKKVNEIIDNNTDFNAICDELGLGKKEVSKLIIKRLVDCTK